MDLTGSVVDVASHHGEVFRIGGDFHAFGEVLAHDPVEVLVAAALPGGVGVGEVDRHGALGDGGVGGHLGAAVPGQRAAQMLGQRRGGGDDGVADGECVAAGQRHEDEEPGGALDQRGDRGAAGLADDQISLPVPGHDAAGGLDGTVVEVDRVFDPGCRVWAASAAPCGAPSAQPDQLAGQRRHRLGVDPLVDALV